MELINLWIDLILVLIFVCTCAARGKVIRLGFIFSDAYMFVCKKYLIYSGGHIKRQKLQRLDMCPILLFKPHFVIRIFYHTRLTHRQAHQNPFARSFS